MTLKDELKLLKTETLKYFNFPHEQLRVPYAPGKWDAHQLLLHIADAEAVFLERMRRMVVSENPRLPDINPDTWCERLDYPRRSIRVARDLFAASRDGIFEMIELLFPEHQNRKGIHSAKGEMTLKALVEFLIWHNKHHLAFVEKAVTKAA